MHGDVQGVDTISAPNEIDIDLRKDPLDESPGGQPLTAYARSKASAEQILLEGRVRTPEELISYRPTSVLVCPGDSPAGW